jgi:adenosine deaminase
MELVDIMIASKNPRVVALSIDGNEARAGRTGPRFAGVYQYAGKAGFKRTVHAGESSGPDGVWDAIQLLGADRIDHGVRAIEDPALVKVLADRKIALGICPVSNLYLKMYPTLKDHPLDALRRLGVPVSINTDDPAHLNIRLENDYADCTEAYGWNDDVLREMATHSIHASFASDSVKAQLLGKLSHW